MNDIPTSGATPEDRLRRLGLELPPAPEPSGLYRPIVIIDRTAYVSGHGPMRPDGSFVTGRVGVELDESAAFDAARLTAVAILATLRARLGTLDPVRRVVKLLGLVNCSPDFEQHPAVVNGCSQVFADLFGPEAGIGARSAVGVGSLPFGIPVEVEAVFELWPDRTSTLRDPVV